MEKATLTNCIGFMLSLRKLEALAGSILYPFVAQASTIFQDELEVDNNTIFYVNVVRKNANVVNGFTGFFGAVPPAHKAIL